MAKRRGTGLLAALGVAALGGAGWTGIGVASHVPTIEPGVTVAGQSLGGLTAEQAKAKLDSWWKTASQRSFRWSVDRVPVAAQSTTLAEAGFVPEDLGRVVGSLPYETYWDLAGRRIGRAADSKPVTVEVGVVPSERFINEAAQFAKERQEPPKEASARYEGGRVVTERGHAGLELDVKGAMKALAGALSSEEEIVLPVVAAPARVSDEELAQISEVVSEFTTKYSEAKANRSSNIRTAARLIDGHILLPGERFCFNTFLGPRTIAKGFKVAGEYRSGRHFEAVGGGICQVSTTLFNAVLLSGLKIVQRSPHSLTVPYVPLGRDAAVSYPKPDFEFENDSERPVALSASAGPGWITFRILGLKPDGRTVEITQRHVSSWGRGVKYVDDSSLPPGTEKVIDKGGSAHRAITTRRIVENGRTVREDTYESVYSGGPRLIGINRAKPKSTDGAADPVEAPPPAQVEGDVPETVPPIDDLP